MLSNNRISTDILPNGIEVIIEEISQISSVSIGVWLKNGSRYETEETQGYFHFIEHLLFKGTQKRSNQDIVSEIDRVGGILNAATNQELTSFYIHVINSHFELAVDILSDMIFNSIFKEEDVEKERKVILEEIKMTDDTPEEYSYEKFLSSVLRGNSLGHSILGTRETIENADRNSIYKFYRNYYYSGNMIISIAGNIDSVYAFQIIRKYFTEHKNNFVIPAVKTPVFFPTNETIHRELKQTYFTIGFPGIPSGHRDRYTLAIINSIFGGSMSSRLFQKIREQHGLVYSIYSTPDSFKDFGLICIVGSCSANNIDAVVQLIKKEIEDFSNGYFSEQEVDNAKEFIKGNLALLYENTEARMNKLAKNQFIYGKIIPFDELLMEINKINLNKARELSASLFSQKDIAISLLGNI